MSDQGTLYICATPIGNLDDMTPRAAAALAQADLVAAEDTRRTLGLLHHLGIKKTLISYHEHNKAMRGPELIERLLAGETVALVSDAGFPGLADPGEDLVKLALAAGITVVPVPGANAALCALVASGLPAVPFFFGGFLPKTNKKRREQLTLWKHIPATILLYEAPHRLKTVLADLLAAWGDREMVMARELTKVHEEFFRGTVSECLTRAESVAPRGEYTLVIAPPLLEEAAPSALPEVPPEEAAVAEVRRLMAAGTEKKEAVRLAAKNLSLPKRLVYQATLALLDRGG